MVQIKHFVAFILGVAAIAPAISLPINTNGDQLEARTLPIPIPPGRKPPPSSSGGSAQSATQHGTVGSLSNKESEGFMTGHCSPHLPPPPPGQPCPQHSPPVGHIVPQQSGSSHPASDHHDANSGSPPSGHHANGHVTTWLKNVQTPSVIFEYRLNDHH